MPKIAIEAEQSVDQPSGRVTFQQVNPCCMNVYVLSEELKEAIIC